MEKTHIDRIGKDIDFIQLGGNPFKPTSKNLRAHKIKFRYKNRKYQGYTAYTKNKLIIGKKYKFWSDNMPEAVEGYLLYGNVIIKKRRIMPKRKE